MKKNRYFCMSSSPSSYFFQGIYFSCFSNPFKIRVFAVRLESWQILSSLSLMFLYIYVFVRVMLLIYMFLSILGGGLFVSSFSKKKASWAFHIKLCNIPHFVLIKCNSSPLLKLQLMCDIAIRVTRLIHYVDCSIHIK